MLPPLAQLFLFFIILLQIPAVGAEQSHSPPSPPQELVFLTWADYIDPEVIQEFEQKFNAKVKEVHFETDDARDALLVETDGRGYDIVTVGEVHMNAYRQRGWIIPLGEEDIPNLKYIDAKWMNALPAAAGFGVPYVWGTTGIAYRADLVPERITSWKQLFQPSETLRGKILMIKNVREVIGIALKALGYSANSTDAKQLAEAEHLLQAQRPYVKSYSYSLMTADSDLVTGQIAAAMMYSGDPFALKQYNPNITYRVPEEGSILWVDYLTVLQTSPNKRLAMDFINFLNEPENAARLARFVHYATPNKAAEKLLPAEFLQDPIIYPSKDALNKSEFLTELPPRITKQRNSIFARLLQ